MTTLFAGFSSQQGQLNINAEPIGPDVAGQYLRDKFPNIPGNKICVVAPGKQLVEATIFWMGRPGLSLGFTKRVSLYQILKYTTAGLFFVQVFMRSD